MKPPGTHPSSRATVPIRKNSGANAARNRAAVKKMTECEALTGMTVDELDRLRADQRAYVLSKYGLAA